MTTLTTKRTSKKSLVLPPERPNVFTAIRILDQIDAKGSQTQPSEIGRGIEMPLSSLPAYIENQRELINQVRQDAVKEAIEAVRMEKQGVADIILAGDLPDIANTNMATQVLFKEGYNKAISKLEAKIASLKAKEGIE